MPETGSSKILYTSRCALVPEQFFEPSSARAMLVETVDIDDTDEVSYVAVPWCSAVLIYARTPGDDSLNITGSWHRTAAGFCILSCPRIGA